MVVMAIRLTLNEFVISLDRLVNMLQMEPPTLQKKYAKNKLHG
jgi:hypothetical protein